MDGEPGAEIVLMFEVGYGDCVRQVGFLRVARRDAICWMRVSDRRGPKAFEKENREGECAHHCCTEPSLIKGNCLILNCGLFLDFIKKLRRKRKPPFPNL